MTIEQNIERIAIALEKLAGIGLDAVPEAPTPAPSKKRAAKPEAPKTEDMIPGVEDVKPEDPIASENEIKTGADLRNLAQKFIQAAEMSDPGGKNSSVNKLVTFIQSVAKIFNAKEPKLIKIPDEKVQEAADMISKWCDKNGIKLPIEV